METDRTIPVNENPAEQKTDAFRKVLELTERIEACLNKGDIDDVTALLNERQLWMDRVDRIAPFRAAGTHGKARKTPEKDAAGPATDAADRSRIKALIRACIDKNVQCEEILQSAREKARQAVAAVRPASHAFSGYRDARKGVPRFVDVRS
jgi:hypothetical protein